MLDYSFSQEINLNKWMNEWMKPTTVKMMAILHHPFEQCQILNSFYKSIWIVIEHIIKFLSE